MHCQTFVALDMSHACDVIRDCGEIAPSLQARMGTGGNQVPLTYQDVTGTLSPGAHAGSYNGQDAYNDMLVCGATPDVAHALRAKAACAYREDAETYPVQNMVVRRLPRWSANGCKATRTAGQTLASGATARASGTRMRTAPGTRHWATPSHCPSGTFWQSVSAHNIFALLRWVVCLTASEAFRWCSNGTTARVRRAGQAKLRNFPLP